MHINIYINFIVMFYINKPNKVLYIIIKETILNFTQIYLNNILSTQQEKSYINPL